MKKIMAFALLLLSAAMLSACDFFNNSDLFGSNNNSTTTQPLTDGNVNDVASTTGAQSDFTTTNTDSATTNTDSTTTRVNSLLEQYKTKFEVGTVPRIDISTNGVNITSKETYVSGSFVLTDSQNPAFNYNSTAKGNTTSIRLRGNTSNQGIDKKSYKIKFGEKVNLCGFGKDKEWGLINSSLDYSFIRNFLAYRMGKLLNFDFSPDCKFVELYLNNEYRGLYLLTELVKTGGNRVDIENDIYEPGKATYDPTLTEVPFLLELDYKIYSEGTKDVDYFTIDSEIINGQDGEALPFSTKYPDDFTTSSINATQYQYIKDSVTELYSCVDGEDYEDVIDVDSFIDYFIIQELFRNIDLEHASIYFYKEPGEKIKFGPIWDFDLTLGNYKYGNHASSSSYWMSEVNKGNRLFNKLMQKASFQEKFTDRYNELCETVIPAAIGSIDKITTDLATYVDRNETKWNVINHHRIDWLTPDWIYDIKSFAGHTSYVKNFLNSRYQWIKTQLTNGVMPTVAASSAITGNHIEAENFSSKDGGLREEDCTDTNGGKDIGYISEGNTLTYQMVGFVSGQYKIRYRIASESKAGGMKIYINNQLITTTTFAITGGWQTWQNFDSAQVNITQSGAITVKLEATTNEFNINWFEFIAV